MGALALADHHGLTGAIEFYDACCEASVRPIVGLELAVLPPPEIAAGPGEVRPFVAGKVRPFVAGTVRPFVAGEVPPFVGGAGSIVLLAADLSGWRSLCQLSTLAQTAPHRDPERGLPFEQLAQYADGLLCLTGGKLSALNALLAQGQPRAAAQLLGAFTGLPSRRARWPGDWTLRGGNGV